MLRQNSSVYILLVCGFDLVRSCVSLCLVLLVANGIVQPSCDFLFCSSAILLAVVILMNHLVNMVTALSPLLINPVPQFKVSRKLSTKSCINQVSIKHTT